MRFAFDARRIYGDYAGLGVYSYQLIKAFAEVDCANYYLIFTLPDSILKYSGLPDNFRIREVKFSVENHLQGDLWRNFTLPRILKKEKIDLFHDPALSLPLFSAGAKLAVTIHDLAHYKCPSTNTFKFRTYMKLMTFISLLKADLILVDSEYIKNELMEFDLARNKSIFVVHLGIDPSFRILEDKKKIDAVKNKYGIYFPYIFCATNIEPRKNLINLIKAFQIFKNKAKTNHILVISGKLGWKYSDVLKHIDSCNLRHSIIFTGYIDREELVALYNSADCFIFPSYYEGFGLPVLEAMACGVPVICANRSSLPEIAGDAAVLVDPFNPEQIAETTRKLIEDESFKKSMIAKGIEHSKKFSWINTAKNTILAYQRILSSSA